MRANTPNAALLALTCLLLCTGPLLARPTHTVAREPAHPLVATPTSHEHIAHAVHHTPLAAKPSRAVSQPASKSHPAVRPAATAKHHLTIATRVSVPAHTSTKHAPPITNRATIDRVHAWQQSQSDAAARAAIASANRGHHLATPDQDDDSAPADTAPGRNLIVNNTLPSVGLLHTAPELPRIKSIEEEALTPTLLPSLYDKRGKLVVPAPLYGSHEVLLHQNQMADRDGLSRVNDDADLLDLRRDRKLVALPISQSLQVDERLPANRRFSRPWTAQFLAVLAHDFYSSFHEPLQVNSAVRTVEFQRRLLRTNGNAAPAAGDTASPHLTGQAVDIGKRGLSLTQIAWMRAYLQPLIEHGSIDVEEEFQQSCFHISVYKNYATPPHTTVAARQLPGETLP